MKGLGAKTRDEILNKREAWTESNLYVADHEENGEMISEYEKMCIRDRCVHCGVRTA